MFDKEHKFVQKRPTYITENNVLFSEFKSEALIKVVFFAIFLKFKINDESTKFATMRTCYKKCHLRDQVT